MTNAPWTSRTFLDWSIDCLVRAGVDSPRLDAEVLLAGALRLQREKIRMEPGRCLDDRELTVSKEYIDRRTRREPVSYILNRKEFWSMEFKVTPEVLVPRPETEMLIERLLTQIPKNLRNEAISTLDIGTGSGNIAITAAKELPHSRVTAVDISKDALAVATENARQLGMADRIRFVHADLFPDTTETYRFILSNPPYIETTQWMRLMPDVKDYEPRLALDGGADGLRFYRDIIAGAHERLESGGGLIFEIGETQGADVCALIRQNGKFSEPVLTQDYSGYDRIVSAERL